MDLINVIVILSSFATGAAFVWLLLFRPLKTEKDHLSKAYHNASQENASLRTANEHLTHDHTRFENLANQILDKKSEKFDKEAKEQIQNALAPFNNEIKNLKESVRDSSNKSFSLREEILRIGAHADNLASALKSSPKTRGNWGEIVLERMLEEAGLRKDRDYITQASGLGLKHEETGQTLRPDVIVKLPESKSLIIDSKLSLVSYEDYCAASDEAARGDHLRKFLAASKRHIQELEQKRYQDIPLGAPDFVMMFMPIEGAYMLALSEDPALHKYAWDKKIVMVSPTSLFATLQTVASLWRLQKQNQNADEIARQGGALYDKVAAFVKDLEGLGTRISQAQISYDETMKKLSTGGGNILSRTEKLRRLGARTAKQLPEINQETD